MKFKNGDLEVEIDRGEFTHEELDQHLVDNFFGNDDAWVKEEYERGHKVLLLWHLYEYVRYQRPIPQWMAEAFCTACKRVYGFEVESWDDVFGRPLKKGKHLDVQRRRLKIRDALYHRVEERNMAGEGIGKSLFESVGRNLT
jgi:hypothetical protein